MNILFNAFDIVIFYINIINILIKLTNNFIFLHFFKILYKNY